MASECGQRMWQSLSGYAASLDAVSRQPTFSFPNCNASYTYLAHVLVTYQFYLSNKDLSSYIHQSLYFFSLSALLFVDSARFVRFNFKYSGCLTRLRTNSSGIMQSLDILLMASASPELKFPHSNCFFICTRGLKSSISRGVIPSSL